MKKQSKGIARVRKLSAAIGGGTEKAYALEPERAKLPIESITRVFGTPVGISERNWPRNRHGDPMLHVLSLDFRDIPELARRKARAVSVFVDDPDVNDCLYEANPNHRQEGREAEEGAPFQLT